MKRGKTTGNKEAQNKQPAGAAARQNGQMARTRTCAGSKKNTATRSKTKTVDTATSLKNDQKERSESDATATTSDTELQLGAVDKLPPVDSPEASNVSAIRLREIARRLETSEIDKTTLVKNLQYAATVLENVYKVETSRMGTMEDDDDDALSEAETKSIPTMVREWLTMTFTRSLTNLRRQDRPHFRSVANAIRAGIVVDRIYRRMSSTVALHLPPDVLMELKNVDDWSFDVFHINEIGQGHALKYVGYELLQRYNLVNKFKISTQTLDNFLTRLEQGYSKFNNPYHNLVHAADVAQTTHHLFSQSGLVLWLTDLEVFAILLSALIHDFEHTGTTNAFHINTSSEVAMTYNDKAVLENYHVSAVFRILKDENYNILANLKKEEYRELRALVIEIVLATDMSFHFQQVKNMKNLLSVPENIDKSKALALLVHCADISHPAKNWSLHSRWTNLLVEEFFMQGEKETELKLPISPLCDRKNTMISESQIGFIEFIVDPSFQVMGDMLDKILGPLQQKRSDEADNDAFDSESLGNANRVTMTGSLDSLKSSDSAPSSPKTSDKDDELVEVKRYWVDCLHENKIRWKEKAVKDAELRAAADAAAAPTQADENLSVTSPPDQVPVDGEPPQSSPPPGDIVKDQQPENTIPESETKRISPRNSSQSPVAAANVSPEAHRAESRATASQSPRESTTTPPPPPNAAVSSRPPSSSIVDRRSTVSRRASSGEQSAGSGSGTAAGDDENTNSSRPSAAGDGIDR